MEATYNRLVQELPELFGGHPDPHTPKMVIAIDEAHKLSKTVQGLYRPSHVLCRVISAFSRTSLNLSNWVVFASTTSRVADSSAPSQIRK